jgi:hypothetical protein
VTVSSCLGGGNLYAPLPTDGGERGRNWKGHTRESSMYTRAALRPGAAMLAVAGLAIGLGALARRYHPQELR